MAENADGSVAIEIRMDVSKADKELAKLKKKIADTEAEIEKTQKARDKARQQELISAEELDREKAKLHEMKQELLEIRRVAKDKTYSPGVRDEASLRGTDLKAEIEDQQERVRMLQAEYSKTASSVERYDQKLQDANETLERQKEDAGELARQIEAVPMSIEKMRDATEKAQKSMGRFNKRIASLMSRALVFSVITKALSTLKSWMTKVIKTNGEAAAAIGKLKGALLTLVQPLVNVVIPAFTSFVNVLAKVTAAVANVLSKLFGTTASESAKAAEKLYEETEALESTGTAAEEAAGSLAGFDEINTIQTKETESGGGSSSLSDKIEPTFGDFSTDEYKNALDELETYIEGAALALGAILCFSGANIPLGISLMAFGAIGLVKELSQNWDTIPDKVKRALTRVLTTLGTAALVIGAILCLSGANIPLGISLMVAGAAMLATAVGLNWDKIGEKLDSTLISILGILGAAALVIGAILCLSGAHIPLGIGLMVAGAATLGAAAGIAWDDLPNKVKQVVTTISLVLGGALLVIGAVLCFAGPATMKLGIGLLAAGAASLGAAVGLNWGYIVGLITENLDTILSVIGGALLAIGVLLATTGVNLPLGIGLIIAGAASLVAAKVIREGYTAQQVREFMTSILAIAGTGLLALGLILCMTGVGIPIGIAMILAGSAGLVTAAALNWDFILKKIKETWADIKEWWNQHAKKYFTLDYWKDIGGDIIDGLLRGLKNAWKSITSWVSEKVSWLTSKFSSATDTTSTSSRGTFSGSQTGGGRLTLQSASISQASIPALAKGAVIPANREFLAVLGDQKTGTNIETPLSTMVEAFKQALAESESGGTFTCVVNLDGREVARNTVRHMNDMTRERGKSVVLV